MDAIRAKQSVSTFQTGVVPETPARQVRSCAGAPARAADQLDLSSQAQAFLRRQSQVAAVQRAALIPIQQSQEDFSSDALSEAMEQLKLCAKIAARIRAGDKVPLKDLRYLMKHDARLYMMAMAMRLPNEDPKKWDSALKGRKEEEQQSASAWDNSAGAPALEASAPAPSAPSADTGGEGT